MGGILWINSLSSAQVHSWKSINNGSYKHIFLPSICCKWRRGSFTRHKEIKCDEMRDCTWVEWISWGKYFLLPVSFFKTVRSDRNGMPCNETVSFLTKKVDKNPRKATTNKLNVFDSSWPINRSLLIADASRLPLKTMRKKMMMTEAFRNWILIQSEMIRIYSQKISTTNFQKGIKYSKLKCILKKKSFGRTI